MERGEWEIWGQTGPVMLCSGNQSQLAVLQGLKNVFLNEKTSLGMSKNVKSKHTTSANWPNQNLEKDALCFPLAETELGAIRSGSRVQTPPDAPRCLGEALNFHRVSRPLCLQNIIPSCLFGRLQGLHPRWKAGSRPFGEVPPAAFPPLVRWRQSLPTKGVFQRASAAARRDPTAARAEGHLASGSQSPSPTESRAAALAKPSEGCPRSGARRPARRLSAQLCGGAVTSIQLSLLLLPRKAEHRASGPGLPNRCRSK